jgi:hypothetical protein
MSEVRIRLKGWQAMAALVVVVAIVVARLVSLGDMTGDAALMQALRTQLVSDYFPQEVADLAAAQSSGDAERLRIMSERVTTARLNVESVQASRPLFSFSTSEEVVVKVTYSLEDAIGTRGRKTKFYLFRHGALGNVWQCRHETGAASFYLNLR